jgi:hypothetical protein
MRWEHGRRSDNIEDRRGMRVGRKGLVGGGIGTIILALVALYFGVDPAVVLNQAGNQASTQEEQAVEFSPEEERLKAFMSVVLADTEDVWGSLFQGSGQHYSPPKLVLFSGAVESACGFAEAAMGPFYCPADQKLYLDMRFFNDLAQRHDAPGDFAQAYVVAHEVGHHVQTLLGISQRGSGQARPRATHCRYGWSCRPTVLPGCGRTTPTRRGRCWNRATSRKPWQRRRAWATTACRNRRAGSWCRIPSPTAPRRSGCTGSTAACKAAIRSSATPSRPKNKNTLFKSRTSTGAGTLL